MPSRILGVNGEDVDDDEIDDDRRLLYLLSLKKILQKATERIVSLEYVSFWMSKERKTHQFRLLLMYESVKDQIREAIGTLCHTSLIEDQDDDFDDYHFGDAWDLQFPSFHIICMTSIFFLYILTIFPLTKILSNSLC